LTGEMVVGEMAKGGRRKHLLRKKLNYCRGTVCKRGSKCQIWQMAHR
jgi:hypothetical protein